MDINETIDELFHKGKLNDYAQIEVKNDISNILYDYQYKHLHNLLFSIKNNNIIIDGSDTGTGKTYTAIALAKQLNLIPAVICPKTTIYNWNKVIKEFNIKPLFVVNYETIKNLKYYKNNKRIDCPYIKKDYIWNLPNNTLLIFDEVHKCNNPNTLNGKLLKSIINQDKCILLSATLADKPENFRIFGYLLKFYKKIKQANSWIKSIMEDNTHNKNKLSIMYKKIYLEKGSRMSIKELGDKFAKNQISIECYDMDNYSKIDEQYKLIKELNKIKDKLSLKSINKARMHIELLKIDTIIQLVNDYKENNFSIVIFVNYLQTLNKLVETLKCDYLSGSVPIEKRNKIINAFQNNKIKILVCITTVGGQGISLHDTIGDSPRVTLISPSYSINTLMQVLGRVYRTGTKSNVLQRVIMCSNTFEHRLCNKLKEKLNFLNNFETSITGTKLKKQLNKIKN